MRTNESTRLILSGFLEGERGTVYVEPENIDKSERESDLGYSGQCGDQFESRFDLNSTRCDEYVQGVLFHDLFYPEPQSLVGTDAKLELRVDLQFFGKVNANVDYYIRRSNAILSREIPLENGKNSMSINGSIIYNRGIEFTVSFTPVNHERLRY